jgi:hypothetical protein
MRSVKLIGSLSGAPQPVTVTVQTVAAVNSVTPIRVDFPPRAIPIFWVVILLGLGWLRLRDPKRMLRPVAVLTLLALVSVAGCDGGRASSPPHTSPGTPVGTYTVAITATSGNLSHNMTLTVVVLGD